MNKLLLLISINLFGSFSVFASNLFDQQQQSNQSQIRQTIKPNPSSASSDADEQASTSSVTSQSSAAPRGLGLTSMPPEILGVIAQHTPEKDAYKLRNMTGVNVLKHKMQQSAFYQEYTRKVIAFSLQEPGSLDALKTLLVQINSLREDSPLTIKLRLIDVTVENLTDILPLCTLVSSLYLGSNKIGNAGARAIASSTTLSTLTSLNLSRNQIGDAGARAIASSTTLPSLTYLSLKHNQISDDEVQAILSESKMKKRAEEVSQASSSS